MTTVILNRTKVMTITKLIQNILYNETNFQCKKINIFMITSDFMLRIVKMLWGGYHFNEGQSKSKCERSQTLSVKCSVQRGEWFKYLVKVYRRD